MAGIERSATDDSMKTALTCAVFSTGLIATLVGYGLLQERIMTISYSGDMFTVSAFLVFCNRVSNCIYSAGALKVAGEAFPAQVPMWKYFIVSLSNVAASTCQYEALKYVSFPVQMLGKSFKMMPVMIWGIVISQKRYSVMDWLIAAAVTGGVTEFLMTGQISSPDDGNEDSAPLYGLLLLLCFLACDGLTSTFQEKLFTEHRTTKFNQMFYVNAVSATVSLIVLLINGTLFSSFAFAAAHGSFVTDALLLCVSASASQYFIYSTVKEFGALAFAAVMNCRQVVSILVSYVTYKHTITWLQVLGLAAVFSALFYKSFLALSSQKKGDGAPSAAGKQKVDEPTEDTPSKQ